MTPNSILKVIENAGHQTLNDKCKTINILKTFLKELKYKTNTTANTV
jgi:hypothetical protein